MSAAHPARIYDYWLGGKNYYLPDQRAADEITGHYPQAAAAARANRAFGGRAVRFALGGAGIRQFLDIGMGFPAPDGTHENVQRLAPGCRVVYADCDPVVVSHGRAFLTSAGPGARECINADVRDPARLLDQAAATLDFSRPVAVLLLAVLHFAADADDPAGIVTTLAGALAPGSMVVVSHLTADFAAGPVTAAAAAYNASAPMQVYPRPRDQVASLLGGLPEQWPGVVPVTRWLPSLREAPGPACDLYGAVARATATGAAATAAPVAASGSAPVPALG
jgi:O-methyltransferase involved in polyketide biosynthesis